MNNSSNQFMLPWAPDSWLQKTNKQAISYISTESLQQTLSELRRLPPLITATEIESLKQHLREAAKGRRFILQGGNCVETFAESNYQNIKEQVSLLLHTGAMLADGFNKPIINIGRIAGQYAKPRSSHMEVYNETKLLSYRGDLIHSIEFNLLARTPDPKRMLQGYYCAAQAFEAIQQIVSKTDIQQQAFYISHEALHVLYEQMLTRQVNGCWYNLGTHFPWVGARTNHIDSAQIEYVRGIANPIGIKISPTMEPENLVKLVGLLNPNNELGRLVLIHRLGLDHIQHKLPPLIKAIQHNDKAVIWMLDPMHGNTKYTTSGIKTRYLSDILGEIRQALQIHQVMQSYLAGIHLELTAENVTECIGGRCGITEQDLPRAYKTLIDPRLNREQAMEIATCLVNMVK